MSGSDQDISLIDLSDANKREFYDNLDLGKHGSGEYWLKYFKDSDLYTFQEQSYKQKSVDGLRYSIRVNPHTGLKELMVAGTDSHVEWGQNVIEGVSHLISTINPGSSYTFSEMERDHFSKQLAGVVDEEGIDVVYGHSRAFATINSIDAYRSKKGHSKVAYIGLDGASFIGHKNDNLNLIGDQVFDKTIGIGHGNNLLFKGRGFHSVTQARKKHAKDNPDKLKTRKRPTKKKKLPAKAIRGPTQVVKPVQAKAKLAPYPVNKKRERYYHPLQITAPVTKPKKKKAHYLTSLQKAAFRKRKPPKGQRKRRKR